MLKRKNIKEKGKISFTRYFQSFNNGDRVALVKDLNFSKSFYNRMQGRTGIVLAKRGNAYVVEVSEGDMKKQFMVKPFHLKKLTT